MRTDVSSSDLVVQSSRLALDFSDSEEEQKEEKPRKGGETTSLGVDLSITTGRNVQFLWPGQAFPILKATARQGSVVKVVYDDETDELIMEGDASVLGGTLFYFDRSFSIREGSISFKENKLQFDPRVSVRAEIRERDEQNQDYRITLEADRVRLSEFSTESIRFSSDPALPSAVIRERIGQSIFSRTSGGASEAGTAALPLIATLTGDVISQVGLLSPVEDTVRDSLGLDLVSIRTQVVQNFLIDKMLSQQGGLDNDGPALGKYFGNTELAVGKYIGDDLFLSMMLRLQTDNEGETGFTRLTGLRPAFEISIEWETPFFTLDWSFLPRHPESLFLSDNTLGFKWRIRY
jgi:translocation and assembly module TamB